MPPDHSPPELLLCLQVGSKVVCMAWTADGMLLALGLYDGSVSLRDKAGTEKHKFTASSSAVWSLAWSPGVSSASCWQAVGAACCGEFLQLNTHSSSIACRT